MQDLKVTLIQSDLVWEHAAKNLEAFDQKINRIKEPTDLIVLPEMFNTGFSVYPEKVAETIQGETFRWMQQTAKEKDAVVSGSLIVQDGNDYFNRMVWMQPNGFYLTYDKRHLFRMGEEHHRFKGGEKNLLVNLKGWRIRPLICYDLRFPVWSKNLYQDEGYEYDILIYVANWPSPRRSVWDTLLKARAIENQSYVLGVNRVGKDGNGLAYNGGSTFIDPKGHVLKAAVDGKEESITQVLSYQELVDFRKKFNVAQDWDRFKLES